jgi:hypothetical protein
MDQIEQRQHPRQPIRELALQLACNGQPPDAAPDDIVKRAEQYATFLKGI